MYQLVFYVPESHKEPVKQSLFDAGAGTIGDYDCCSWETLGQGQFKPSDGSQPFIGSQNTLEILPEYKVEMVCDKPSIKAVVEALISSHPYEEPAYSVQEILSIKEL
ncbi:MAG: NGG1p interacting factor NIF3 [Kangiellaceae bacterium]|nr:NGG1p interacting factor NIF3 [Kangiellaceae bacterium]